ncbi:MAG TPA: 50S ribosomal protein L5, partial [Alphaproteobacteria bacterium]|nr:50S ribosomal protein L5 [Alphaproteobacteria bacterium]
MTAQEKYTPRLEKRYKEELAPAMQKSRGYKNVHEIPKLKHITINMGVGQAAIDKKHMETALKDMTQIAGQKPIATLARKSNASFKIRQGMPIGAKVTLRGKRMYEFL